MEREIEKRFCISVVCSAPTLISLLLLPLSEIGEDQTQKIIGIFVGILFWVGILLAAGSYFQLYRTYKEHLKESVRKVKIPSFLHFFSNPIAIAVDSVLILSFIGTIYCTLTVNASEVLDFISLVLCVTSLYLHFLVNGRIFQYIVQRKKRGKGYERKA